MNAFIVTAPVANFSGESAGVAFKDGAGRVDDSTKSGRAAIEYFRRRGYSLTAEGADEEPEAETVEPRTPDEGDEPFDPSKHDAPDVIAYLEAHAEDEDEVTRVLEAEKNGKARKTVLQKGAEQ